MASEQSRLDEAVEAAMKARRRSYGTTTRSSKEAANLDAMRAALLAALPVLLGPVVDEWRSEAARLLEKEDERDPGGGKRFAEWVRDDWKSRASELNGCAATLERVYAPDHYNILLRD